MLILILQYGVYWCMYRNVVLDCMYDTSVQSDSGVGPNSATRSWFPTLFPTKPHLLLFGCWVFLSGGGGGIWKVYQVSGPIGNGKVVAADGLRRISEAHCWYFFFRLQTPPTASQCMALVHCIANSVKFDGALTVQNMPILHLSSMVTCSIVGEESAQTVEFSWIYPDTFPPAAEAQSEATTPRTPRTPQSVQTIASRGATSQGTVQGGKIWYPLGEAEWGDDQRLFRELLIYLSFPWTFGHSDLFWRNTDLSCESMVWKLVQFGGLPF